jgi:DNA polymerase delta subunit 3
MVCVVSHYHYSWSYYYFSTDQVEKVVHETSTNASTANDDDEKEQMDDVDMADGTTAEPKKIRKKREKKTIPVGKNGLKKKKVMKTKKTMDDNGYMRKYLI